MDAMDEMSVGDGSTQSSGLNLTPEQISSLFGDKDVAPGAEYTVTLRAGDGGSFDVVSVSDSMPAEDAEASDEHMGDPAEETEAAATEGGPKPTGKSANMTFPLTSRKRPTEHPPINVGSIID